MFYFKIAFIFSFLQGSFLIAVTPTELSSEIESLTETDRLLFYSTAKELKCPTCNGLSIDQSNATFSLHMKRALLDQIKAGQKDKEMILKFFVDRYGLFILREPPKEGFHLVAWLLPLLIFGAGFLLFFILLKRKNTSPSYNTSRRSRQEIAEEFAKAVEKKRFIRSLSQ